MFVCKFDCLVELVLMLQFCSLTGAIYCWECTTSQGNNCTQGSLNESINSHCGRAYEYCAVYKSVMSDNSPGLFTRACISDCHEAYAKWTTGKYVKTTHCRMCCKTRYRCNDFLGDPCNPNASGMIRVNGGFILLMCVLGWFIRS